MKRFLLYCLTLLSLLGLTGREALAGAKIQHWVSPNGVRVYFVENHTLPMLDMNIDFAAGSAYDPTGKSGLSSLLMTMIDLGAGELDETAIANGFADLGAKFNGSSDIERFSLTLRTLSAADKRDAALALVAKILQSPRLEATILERERARTIAALKEALTRPDSIANRTFWQKLYPDHPYGKESTPESLGAISRDDLVQFYQRYLTRKNAIVTLVGDLTRPQAEALVEQLLAGLPEGAAAPVIAAPGQPAMGEHKVAHPASQAHLFIGVPSIERGNLDIFPLIVGNYTLGGGSFVSRLMHEVREKKGYVYGIYSTVIPLRQPGPFYIGLQTKRAQTKEALALTRQVFDDFMKNGPTEAELKAAKDNLIGSFPLRLDSNKKLLDNVAAMAFYGLPLDWLDKYQERIHQVSRAEVKRVFNQYIAPQKLVTVVVAGD
jgi:zinc protease